MSTLSTPFEKGIRHIVLFDAVAAQTTIKTFMTTAANKTIGLFSEGGATAAAAGKDILIAKKGSDGRVSHMDLITGKDIVNMRTSAPVAKVGRAMLPKIDTVVIGQDYFIDLKVNYGTVGEVFTTVLGSARAVTGDTPTTLATKLAVSLCNAIDKSEALGYQGSKGTEQLITGTQVPVNRYFRVTQAAGVITITEKDFILNTYVPGIRAVDQLNWNAVVRTSADTYGTPSVNMSITSTAGTYPKGQGYQIRELEHYLGSHVKTFGFVDRTMSLPVNYESDLAGQYYTVDFEYHDIGRDDPQRLVKGILFATTSKAEVNKLGNAIALAGGPAWTDYV